MSARRVDAIAAIAAITVSGCAAAWSDGAYHAPAEYRHGLFGGVATGGSWIAGTDVPAPIIALDAGVVIPATPRPAIAVVASGELMREVGAIGVGAQIWPAGRGGWLRLELERSWPTGGAAVDGLAAAVGLEAWTTPRFAIDLALRARVAPVAMDEWGVGWAGLTLGVRFHELWADRHGLGDD